MFFNNNDLLCVFIDKYIVDLNTPVAGKVHQQKKESLPVTSIKSALGGRQSRPDSVFHYPFADNAGSVTEVLHGPAPVMQQLLSMGAPARKRLIAKIFDEMRFSKVGLRMSDLPEALEVMILSYLSII